MKKRTKLFSLVLALILALSTLAILPASAANATATGWDGSQSLQPMGSGTEEDPYLIATAANLKWLANQAPQADIAKYKNTEASYVGDEQRDADGVTSGFLKGKYFRQIADIDLNGKNFVSIGYYFSNVWGVENDQRMSAFAGNYDGNGYVIKNGNVVSYNTGHGINMNWGHGLFGMIYGSTIKNITLENMTITGHGMTGGIVGFAIADTTKTASATTNFIENCILKNSVTVNGVYPVGKEGYEGNYDMAGRVGGIVGAAYGTTIRNCVNNATINTVSGYNYTGGIAATAGFGTVVTNCVNNGNIVMNATDYAVRSEHAIGGIVGFITPYGAGKAIHGSVEISKCYNTGSLTINGTVSAAVDRGGILGATNSLTKGETYVIDQCYNLNAADTLTASNLRFGGLVGVCFIGNGDDCGTLNVSNSYSVTISPTANQYGSTNEYCTNTDRKTKDGLVPLQIKLTDGTFTPALNGSYVENVTIGTKTASEMASATAAIDAAIAAAALPASTVLETATKPIGDGTANAPYLVETAENLVWLREQVANGTEDASAYYIQIADIDLDGHTIYPIGESTAKPFKGVYDGKGYSIKNGIITTVVNNHAFDLTFGTGLFGVVQGATVRGVVLDGVTVDGYGITGGIVGIAYATSDTIVNKVQNCQVKATSMVKAQNPVGSEAVASTFEGPGIMGGVLGMAYATSVEACVNEAKVLALGSFSHGAGIAGTAGAGTEIKNCVNKGATMLDHSKYKISGELGWGGIVGFTYPYKAYTPKGGLNIEYCYNSGAMYQTGTPNSTFYWGGIVGGFNSLPAGYTFKISHCYNTNAVNYINNGGTNNRIAGLVGVYWTEAKTDYAPLKIDNSYSVKITSGGNTSSYHGTNEYRAWLNRNVEGGLPCISIMLSDGTYGLGLEKADSTSATYLAGVTVGTKTASEMADAIAAVNTAITSAQTAAYHGSALISYKGYQSTAPADGKVDLRLVFGIDVPENELGNYSRIHVYAIGSSNYESLETTKVYTSIQGTKADSSPVTYTASEFGTQYLAALKVTGVPTTGTYTLKLVGIISSRTVGDSYEVSTITVTITNGAA